MLCAMRLTTCPQSRRRLLDETALALRWAQCGGGSTGSCGLAAALARKVSAPLCVGRREHRRNSDLLPATSRITSISRAPICSSDSIGKLNGEPASLASSPRGKRSATHSRLAVEIHEDWIEARVTSTWKCCAIRHFVRRSRPQRNRAWACIASAKPPISQRFSRTFCSVFGEQYLSVE